MTKATKKSSKVEKPGGITGIITNTYEKTMGFGERVSVATLNMPYLFLESVGVAEDKTAGVKGFNTKVVGSVYKGTDWMARKSANVSLAPFRFVGRLFGGKAAAKPAKKAPKKKEAKKPEAKKAALKAAKRPVGVKKAPAKKKAPPRVAAAKRPTKLAA